MRGQRELRDIAGHHGEPDLAYLQRKVSAGGEMKTTIKQFLDWWDCSFPNQGKPLVMSREGRSKVRRLRAAMEAWCNA